PLLPSFYEAVKFSEEFVGSQLVGILSIEIGIVWVEMIAQGRLIRPGPLHAGNRPGPGTRRSWRHAEGWRQRVAFAYRRAGARLMKAFLVARAFTAPRHGDEFPVIPIREVVARQVVPQETGSRGVHIGHMIFQGQFVRNHPLVVVCPLTISIGNLP